MSITRLDRDFGRLDQEFDVVIVGGGITGIAIARECAVRSLKTCLLEKNDFANATSAGTSKLIHGGFRYLQNYEFGLVRESLAERRILGCAAPHLVMPLPLLFPMYADSKPGRLLIQLGMYFYDTLAFDRNWGVPKDKRIPRHRWLSADEVARLEPTVPMEGLRGAFLFHDYKSLFPERLAMDWAMTAARDGALLYNHAEVFAFDVARNLDRKRLRAVEFRDTLTNKKYKVRGKLFVNATGPWMDLVLGMVEETPETSLSRSTGIHFLSDSFLKSGHGILFRTPSGRHFFSVPWNRFALTGPTDMSYQDHPDRVAPRAEEVQQLFGDVNETLSGAPLEKKHIRFIPIGIRPLVFSGKSTYRASRKSEIYDHTDHGFDGFLSVAGGKWTTSRRLGEDVVHHLLQRPELASRRSVRAHTRNKALISAPAFGASAEEYIETALRRHSTPRLAPEVHRHLITTYGVRHEALLELIRENPKLGERISQGAGVFDVMAEIDFAVLNESALTLKDIVCRRLLMGSFGQPEERALGRIADRAARLLSWKSARKQKELRAVREFYKNRMAALSALPSSNGRKSTGEAARLRSHRRR
ncbi:MAG: glycerol-3-phosphate dehydrogenase/oxidase [Leptospirales bacterium]|nr:glycerol-3-phosphate dehydrogenase/oxidase [Leptospirales bacterium]